jgi:hypothetical protein
MLCYATFATLVQLVLYYCLETNGFVFPEAVFRRPA